MLTMYFGKDVSSSEGTFAKVNLLKCLPVTLCTTRFDIQKFCVVITWNMIVLYGSRNKQQILPYATLKEGIFKPRWRVFTARFAKIPYITQIRFVFKRIKPATYTYDEIMFTRVHNMQYDLHLILVEYKKNICAGYKIL
jgi:hypothetical protein